MTAGKPTPGRADRTTRNWLLAWDVIKRLPAPAAFALGRAGGALWYRTDARRREALRGNLRQVVGSEVSERDLDRLVRRAFAGYGRYWIEAFRLERLSAAELRDRVTFPGREHLDAAVATGRGVVVAVPHIGNWDAGGAWLGAAGYAATAVAERLEPEALYERFKRYREHVGLKILPLAGGSETMRGLVASLRAGRIVTLVADRDITGHGVEVTFFGRRTSMPAGPARLALRTGAVLLPGVVYQDDRPGHWIPTIPGPIEFTPTGDLRADVAALTQQVAAALEPLIAAAPQQWYVLSPFWRDRRPAPTPAAPDPAAPDPAAPDPAAPDAVASDAVAPDADGRRPPA